MYTRQIIETETAKLAARLAKSDDIEELKRIHSNWIISNEQNQDPFKWDLVFHTTVAEVSGNVVLVKILQLLESMMRKYSDSYFMGVDASCAQQQHLEIINAIESRNEQVASSAMKLHLVESHEGILRKFGSKQKNDICSEY